jgi:RimJ/RimL family protein N-acetyltransferase
MEKLDPLLLDIPAELAGERVLLRALRDEDAPAIWEMVEASRAHLEPWMPWVHEHRSPEFSQAYVRRMQGKWTLREDFVMGIFREGDGRMVGNTGIHRIDWSVPSMEIGYWVRPEEQGKGYISEAVSLLRAFAFNHLRAERLTIMCNSRNVRSAAVPRRLGFRHEGTLRGERRDVGGVLRDTELFAMTRADFETWLSQEAR